MNRAQRGGIALLIVMSLVPQGSASGSGAARLEIPRVVRVPSLDSLVARVSASGSALADFRQREPGDGIPSSLPTAASVFYDEDNLYVLFVCKDERRKIRAHLAKREDISGDDQVVVYVDTFGDRRRAYLFASNPLGVQLDGTITEGQDEDDSFDTLWYSEGKLTKDGYAVLMTIPFRSLRFSNAASHGWSSPATWGLLAGAAALLSLFTWWQARASHPLLPLRVLADRNRGASFIMLALSGAGLHEPERVAGGARHEAGAPRCVRPRRGPQS